MKLYDLTILTVTIVMITMLNISYSSADRTFYIIPSSNVSCPVDPCLTLSQFAQNSSSLLSHTSNATLVFLNGNHRLETNFSVSYFNRLHMITNAFSGDAHTITCQNQVSFHFENVTELWINGLMFIRCGSNTFSCIKNFVIENSTFEGQNSSSTALEILETNLKVMNSSFLSNRVGRCHSIYDIKVSSNVFYRVGGAIFVKMSNVSIVNSTFLNNSAEVGGAIYSNGHEINHINISKSTFINNQATIIDRLFASYDGRNNIQRTVGGAVAIFNTTMVINGSIFINNTSSEDGEGGALSIQQKSVTNIHDSEFLGNSANTSGGALFIRESDVIINRGKFQQNNASKGGVMGLMQHSTIALINSTFMRNSAKLSGGVASIDQSSNLHDSHGLFIHNRAHKAGGVLCAIRSGLMLNYSIFSFNHANENGGAIYILQSLPEVRFYGFCKLIHNSAGIGGAIYAIESTLSVLYDNNNIVTLSISLNIANDSGGGIYLYRSSFIFHPHDRIVNISNNTAINNGGGIYAINSLITCTELYTGMEEWPHQNLLIFSYNNAHKGGGLYMESAAQLRVQKVRDYICAEETSRPSISFLSNSAQYGEAIYVADETYLDVCDGVHSLKTATNSHAHCFIQVFSNASNLIASKGNTKYNIEFSFSGTQITSTIIFGGLLDRCIPDPRAGISTTDNNSNGKIDLDGFTYLKYISNIKYTKQISSLPVRVCFCTQDGKSNCSYRPPIIHIKRGEKFNVSVAAVDQVNHPIKNVIIYSSLNGMNNSLGEGQSAQVTEDSVCTNLTFSIYSPHTSEELILYADGPCRNARASQAKLSVHFRPCTCPIGFQLSSEINDCVCICDSRLIPYFNDENKFGTESLTRHGTFWVTFISSNHHCNIGSLKFPDSSGFLIYPYCPLDYCLPPNSNIHINFNLVNGSDAQCAYNRSGLLCSHCQPGLSLSHGSSRCIPCSKEWYKNGIPIVVISIGIGTLLVALLMILNLTVAVGTLNGLIFFANIVDANTSTFFSGLSLSARFYSVLISWLNLEVGFDVCYFEGADIYWKIWLKLAFSVYIIFLVVVMIVVSNYSMRFSRLIAKRNPVATLSTLIQLSYTKFLQTTIMTLSLVTLHYPDGSYKTVWLPDATVEYFSGKHIALFIVAIIILIVGSAYTLILFLWQWLLHHQDKIIFRWVGSQRLCHFIEPYHAPYVPNHRYWTGLLLFTRIVLYLVFALNVSGDPGVNLLAIMLSMIILLAIKGQVGCVYKSIFVDAIETICYVNLCVFSAAKLKFGNEKIVYIIANMSGIITLTLLAVVFAYHTYNTFCTKVIMKIKRYQHLVTERQLDDSEHSIPPIDDTITNNELIFSVVDKLPGSATLDPSMGTGNQRCSEESDETDSLISADSASPLVDVHD